MSNMKLLMERWNGYLLTESFADLKSDPDKTEEFLKKLSDVTDRQELQGVLTVLLSDPQIKAAAEVVNDLNQEIEQQTKDLQSEGILDDFALKPGHEAYKLMNSPTFAKLVKIGGPITALAMIATGLVTQGAIDFEMLTGALKVAQASSAVNIENGLEIAEGIGDVAMTTAVGKREVEDY